MTSRARYKYGNLTHKKQESGEGFTQILNL